MSHILISAHAGGPEGYYKPNSIQAALAVRDDGVDLIEFDVHSTKDGRFVTLHDSNLEINDKVTNIANLTYEEVLANSSSICLLDDMLYTIKDHAIAHVDIKCKTHEVAIVDICIEILGKHGFIITTTEDKTVKKIRKARPDVQVALTIGRDTRGLNTFKSIKIRLSEYFPNLRIFNCKPTMLAICYKEAPPWTLYWAKKHNLPVILWTIDTPEMIRSAWANKNIWAFVTNNPRKALSQRYEP